ncbi:MAG: DUF1080 domain-containing protein [Pyrinomonadaceae bacterium]
MRMKLILMAVAVLAVVVMMMAPRWTAAHASLQQKVRPQQAPLFDARSFAGWEGDLKMFRIERGAIVGGTLQADVPRNEFLCTRREYANFTLRLKFKLLGAGANAGVQFRSQRIAGDHEVIGYQADLGDGWWGSLYDESRRNVTLAKPDAAALIKSALRKNDWNSYEIRADGPRVQLRVNDTETVDYTEQDKNIIQKGVICLQIHGGKPSEAWYKDISIAELPQRRRTTSAIAIG